MLLAWPYLALRAGQEATALAVAAAACQALPRSRQAWQTRLDLEARHATLKVRHNCRLPYCPSV